MKRIFFAFLTVTAMLFALAAPAAADDHSPTMTAEPANVDAAGEYEFMLMGEDFEEVGGFIIPCPGLPITRVTEEDFNVQTECDLATGLAGGSYTVEDRAVAHTMTLDVPAEGLAMVFGDQGGSNAGAFMITVGAAEAMADEAMEDAEEAETMEDMDDEAGAEAEEMTDLADTGVESALLLVLGGAIVIAGALFVNTRRELTV